MDPSYSRQAAVQKIQKNDMYNVYAAPFVSTVLQQINKEPGHIWETPSRHFIDYPQYISSFAGYSFLPRRTPYPTTVRNQTVSKDGPRANNYLEYFTMILQTEIAAKEVETEKFSMYKAFCWLARFGNQRVGLEQLEAPGLFAISVPGLRENSPHVELGDTLELRQLMVTYSNTFVGDIRGYNQQSWTGVVYHASVHGIHRAEEKVYLKVDGLREIFPSANPHNMTPIMVNVVFPLKKRTMQAYRDAMMFIDGALNKAIESERQMLKQSQQKLGEKMVDFVLGQNEVNGGAAHTNGTGIETGYNDWIRRMLFPVDSDGKIQTQLRKVPQRALFDSLVNYEQAHAVNSVCINDYGCLPYLISGPPGTGKTKTIVETAMQLLNSHITDHILICAPSESAGDTLALRLKEYLDTTQLLRLNGPWRADNEVAPALMQYTYMETDMFALPPFKQLMAYNIVVTSCRDASILVEARLTNTDLWTLEKNMLEAFKSEHANAPSNLHWGALLLDEAAQGTELDVLSAISAVCPPPEYPTSLPQPRFVLAGDEKQLGPKTSSHDPQCSQSLFARLFDRPIYKNHPLSRANTKPSTGPPVLRKSMLPILHTPFTNLIRNYRSHPAILSVPSSLFYADTLLPEATTPNTPLQSSSLWHGEKWPVLFVPHPYVEEIERDNGGWYNAEEARLACDFAAHLIRHDAVVQSDIAIISPFAAQVKRIRAVIRSSAYGFWDVNIGPLEAFQGLEKRVVIIATTRTRGKNFVERDVERGLGLIHQPRKMNVALTRAREALIVLGSASALAKDDHWREFLAFCWRNGLVKDDSGWWIKKRSKYEDGSNARVGVLEKALLAKKSRGVSGDGGRVLGGKAVGMEDNYDGDYEAWVESLKEAMDEEVDSFEGEENSEAGKEDEQVYVKEEVEGSVEQDAKNDV
jgi:helicase MOV-10